MNLASARGLPAMIGVALFVTACRVGGPTSPEALRDAYADAIENDDPDAAYELLSEDAQRRVDRAAFRAHWAQHRAELEQTAAEIRTLDPAARHPVWYGETTHPSGRTLRWVAVDGRYRVIDGLPGQLDLSTPERAVAALVVALRQRVPAPIAHLATDDLAERINRRWLDTAEAIESALTDPRALEVSDDGTRAVLTYGTGQHLVLRRVGAQWRVDELE